jgi:excisionase family DNA binding protein
MAENNTSEIPGYISTKQAAQMLGVSHHRLYQYVKAGRLPVVHVGKAFMLRTEDVEHFKPNPSGRMRTKALSWRVYRSRGTVLATEIRVQVRPHQQQELRTKLRTIQQSDQHTFPGTLARYVIKGGEELTEVHILLLWKDTEMPDEETRLHDLAALKDELADVLDWETAQESTNEVLLHT